MKKVFSIILIFIFVNALCSCTFNNNKNDIDKKDTSDEGIVVSLSNEEMIDLLCSDREFRPTNTCIGWIMDSLINNDNLSSLYLFEITSVKKVLCFYTDKRFVFELNYDQFGTYINDEEIGEWVEYRDIDFITEMRGDKKLYRTYLVYEMTVIQDIFSHTKTNYKTVFYDEYYENKEPDIKMGYYLLYSNIDDVYSKNYINMQLMKDCGFVYEIINEDLYYYVKLLKQQRYKNETYSILTIEAGDYYDLIKPYLVDDSTLTISAGGLDNYYDYTKMDISDLVEIINDARNKE